MLISSFPAGIWQTNCYVVSTGRGNECVIIDPGFESAEQIAEIVKRDKLKPIATMLTHGHIDHMWSVAPVASGYGIPAVIHSSDRHLLSDPLSGVSRETQEMLMESLAINAEFVQPEELIIFEESTTLNLAGIEFQLTHAPGHTEGSTIFSTTGNELNVFTGDVLFAGAIGRTDLPGGSSEKMERTLAEVILNLDDDFRILPGHGPESVMAIERANNPFLLRITQGLNR